MNVAIMQPYFLPYIGYWQLYYYADDWIFFDIPRFQRKSWITRNKILHPAADKGTQHITVPVLKQQFGVPIAAVRVNNKNNWQQTILGKFTAYKSFGAPYYADVIDIIKAIFDEYGSSDKLISLIDASFRTISSYLELLRPHRFLSETEYQPPNITMGAGDWALSVCGHFGYHEYVNPSGGVDIFDESKYTDAGVALRFLRPSIKPYPQAEDRPFVPSLSIIDVLLWNSPEETRDLLKQGFDVVHKKDLSNDK